MKRLVLIALAASACGSETDDRPATLDYITQTILAPSCANAECHSAFKREVGDQFDTTDATRLSLVANSLVVYPDDTTDPHGARLVQALRVGLPSILSPGDGNVRMPYDAAMPEADILLIEKWIGLGAEGAQCVANAAGRGCSVVTDAAGQPTYQIVDCVHGNVGNVIETCAAGKICAFALGNGQCL